jgi:hypothetical protein
MNSPFKFLDPYTLQDREVFFGRDTEVDELYSLVFKTPLLLVYGLSGTGKTSLIQCGLAGRFDGPDWYPLFIRKGDDINESLSAILKQTLGDKHTGDLVDDVSYLLRRSLRPVYLMFDQFEELFILGTKEEQELFFEQLATLLSAGLSVHVILIMREEYIGQLYNFENVIPQLFDHRFRVERMGTTQVKSVITQSFGKFNVHLEDPADELVNKMIDNISDEKTGIPLPYLQVYLDMLYRAAYDATPADQREGELPDIALTRKIVDDIGQIDDVLERFLLEQQDNIQERISTAFPEISETAVHELLDAFVTEHGTKRPISFVLEDEMIIPKADAKIMLPQMPADLMSACISELENARILRVSDDRIELAHDALGVIIDQNRSDEQRQLNAVSRRLTNAYEDFLDTHVYLNARQLASIEDFLDRLELPAEIQQFIEDSRADIKRQEEEKRELERRELEVEQQKQTARMQRIFLVIVGVFAAMAVWGWWTSYNNANALEKQNQLVELQNDTITDAKEAVELLLESTTQQADSIRNIIFALNKQMESVDSVIATGSSTAMLSEMRRTLLAFRTILKKEFDPETRERFGISREFATASAIDRENTRSQGIWTISKSNSFGPNQPVHVYLRVATQQSREVLQLKWFGPKDELLDTQFLEIYRNPQRGYQSTSYKQFRQPGEYKVRLYNYLGIEIAQESFNIL